jgi:hypothetical protein
MSGIDKYHHMYVKTLWEIFLYLNFWIFLALDNFTDEIQAKKFLKLLNTCLPFTVWCVITSVTVQRNYTMFGRESLSWQNVFCKSL